MLYISPLLLYAHLDLCYQLALLYTLYFAVLWSVAEESTVVADYDEIVARVLLHAFVCCSLNTYVCAVNFGS